MERVVWNWEEQLTGWAVLCSQAVGLKNLRHCSVPYQPKSGISLLDFDTGQEDLV